jgi:lipid A 4'-phosphatase
MSALPLYRRDGLPELAVLLGLAIVATIVFAATPMDVAACRPFYRGDEADRWPVAKQPFWSLLYGAAPWLAASLVLAGLGVLVVGLARHRDMLLRQGVFLLLAVVLGPGLVVNFIFKDHWHRPRPRDIVEFGGPLHYAPALVPGGEGGGSFPCGHCSVGFLYGAGWWVWKRRRPAWARASLATGIVAGFAIGLGRMAAGGHFLSDVVWSGLLALGIAHALYHYVLRMPAHERAAAVAAPLPVRRPYLYRATAILAALGGVGVLVALFATPHGTSLATRIPLTTLPQAPWAFELVARRANVDIVLVDSPSTEISIAGELHGFGLPTSRLGTRVELDFGVLPTVQYRIVQRGWFTDLDGAATVRLPAGELQRVAVRLERGNIRVTDKTRARVATSRGLTLDLVTASGHVLAPSPPRRR